MNLTESILNEEYLFEEYLHDDYCKNSTKLWFHIRPRERARGNPHIHISNIKKPTNQERKSKKYFECCLLLRECGYWNHEPWHRKILNNKMKDGIVNFLNSSIAETKGKTVWDYLRNEWIRQYPDSKLKALKQPPDYSKLSTELSS